MTRAAQTTPGPDADTMATRAARLPRTVPSTMNLALFDLDHTLLTGDSDFLWCRFLVDCGLLDAEYGARSAALMAQYTAGTVAPQAFCEFSASTVAGRTVDEVEPLRRRFLHEVVRPLIPADARALLQRHRDAGDLLLLTTAANRVVSELTATDLGFEHFLCTELEVAGGRYTGRTLGTLNMRTGKHARLLEWLAARELDESPLRRAVYYTDSINDLALLSVVGQPVVVDPDPRLEATALRKRWTVLRFERAPGRAH